MTLVAEPTRVVEPDDRLDGLIETILTEHALTQNAFRSMVPHAIAAGVALLEARRIVGEEAWRQWLADNFDLGQQSAKIYQRLATYRRRIDRAISEGWQGGINEAMDLVSGFPDVGGARSFGETTRKEARELCVLGLDHVAIADIYGVSPQTARGWVDPAYKAKRIAATDRSKKQRLRARRALERQERDAAVKAKGGSLGRAYNDLLALAKRIDGLARESADDDAQQHLWKAYQRVRQAEDEIVMALGIHAPVTKPRGKYARQAGRT